FNGSIWTEVEAGGSANPTPNWLNVKAYGAVGNGRWDIAAASGTTVTLKNKLFAQSDVGKPILLTGGAATGTQAQTGPGTDLWTTIQTVATNGQSCTVATSVSVYFGGGDAGSVFWGGTDDTTAIQAAINAASESQAVLYFPAGVYVYSKQLTNTGSDLAAIVGDGAGVSILLAQNPAVTAPTGCMLITTEYPFQIKNLWVRGPSSYQTVGYTAEVEVQSSILSPSGIFGTSGAENVVVSDCYAVGLYLYANGASSFAVPTSIVNCHGVNTPNGGLWALVTGPLAVSGSSDTGQMYFRAYNQNPISVDNCSSIRGINAPGGVLKNCVITSNSFYPLITDAFVGSKFDFCTVKGGNWTNCFYQSNVGPQAGTGDPTFISTFEHCECDFVQFTGAASVFFNADLTQGDVSLLAFRNCKVAQLGDISAVPSSLNTSPVRVSTGTHDTSVSTTIPYSPNTTTGNAVIIGVITSASGTSTVTDFFNTFNQIGSTIPLGTYNLQIFLTLNAHARSSFVVTPSAGVALVTYIEMAGLPSSSAVDGTLQSTTGTVGAGGTVSLPITTGQNDDYVVSMAFVAAGTGAAITQASPFLGPVLSPASAVGIMNMGSAVAPGAGVATAAWTLAGPSGNDYAILNLALKVTASLYPKTTSFLINGEGSTTDFSTQVLFENCSSTISRNSASLHLQATNVSTPGSTVYAYGTPAGAITLINFMAYDYFTGALTPPANGFKLDASNAYFLNSQANTANASLTNGSAINGVSTAGSSAAVGGTPVSILPLDSPTNSGVSNKTGQTGTITSTTLVNVAAGDSGLWRISVYGETTSAGTGGTATPAFAWTDDNGSETLTYGTALDLTGTTPLAGSVMVRAVGGTSGSTISYSVTVAGATGSPVYSSFVSVERIS
ncbi:MAG: glycosyl hydrolase family 28-related protein, partial [Candidatus Acidiferrales bacterium]